MVYLTSSGSFDGTINFLKNLGDNKVYDILDRYGEIGVGLLSAATPVETGETAHSWEFKVTHTKDKHAINWYNTHRHEGVNIAVILQYGHGTGTGGYVEGIDYINPALRPLFDKIVEDVWREVTSA